jgi:hypothetical protein
MIEVQPIGHTDAQRPRAGCRTSAHTIVPVHNTYPFARSGAERNNFPVANRCTAHATRSFTSHALGSLLAIHVEPLQGSV